MSDCRKCGEPYCVCGDRINACPKVAAILACGLIALVAGCGQAKPAYSPAQAKACAALEAAWVAAVVHACYGKHELADCPEVPALSANLLKDQNAEGCR